MTRVWRHGSRSPTRSNKILKVEPLVACPILVEVRPRPACLSCARKVCTGAYLLRFTPQAEFFTAGRHVLTVAVTKVVLISRCFGRRIELASVTDLNSWWPRANYVDIVGMNAYLKSSEKASESLAGDFCSGLALGNNEQYVLGEMRFGAGGNGVLSDVCTDVSSYPCYRSTSGFDYMKGSVDFRVVQGQDSAMIRQGLSNSA